MVLWRVRYIMQRDLAADQRIKSSIRQYGRCSSILKLCPGWDELKKYVALVAIDSN